MVRKMLSEENTFLSLILQFRKILSQVFIIRCCYDPSITVDYHNETWRIKKMSRDEKILWQRHLDDHPTAGLLSFANVTLISSGLMQPMKIYFSACLTACNGHVTRVWLMNYNNQC